jgi:hypothetical protein
LLFIECSDVAGREHIVHVNLPPDYPEKQPLATADLPIAVELQWGPDGTMNAILSQFQLVGFTFSFLKYVSLSTVAFALKG